MWSFSIALRVITKNDQDVWLLAVPAVFSVVN
jgi:hypothetical protein